MLAGDEHFPTYRAILVDVGAFTTDVAALTVDTGGTKRARTPRSVPGPRRSAVGAVRNQ